MDGQKKRNLLYLRKLYQGTDNKSDREKLDDAIYACDFCDCGYCHTANAFKHAEYCRTNNDTGFSPSGYDYLTGLHEIPLHLDVVKGKAGKSVIIDFEEDDDDDEDDWLDGDEDDDDEEDEADSMEEQALSHVPERPSPRKKYRKKKKLFRGKCKVGRPSVHVSMDFETRGFNELAGQGMYDLGQGDLISHKDFNDAVTRYNEQVVDRPHEEVPEELTSQLRAAKITAGWKASTEKSEWKKFKIEDDSPKFIGVDYGEMERTVMAILARNHDETYIRELLRFPDSPAATTSYDVGAKVTVEKMEEAFKKMRESLEGLCNKHTHPTGSVTGRFRSPPIGLLPPIHSRCKSVILSGDYFDDPVSDDPVDDLIKAKISLEKNRYKPEHLMVADLHFGHTETNLRLREMQSLCRGRACREGVIKKPKVIVHIDSIGKLWSSNKSQVQSIPREKVQLYPYQEKMLEYAESDIKSSLIFSRSRGKNYLAQTRMGHIRELFKEGKVAMPEASKVLFEDYFDSLRSYDKKR